MTLIDEMAKRIYEEAFPPEDQKGWDAESEGMKCIFRDYAAAARSAILDCEDVAVLLSLLNPTKIRELRVKAQKGVS